MASKAMVWLAGLVFLSACSTGYRGASIEGQVVDAISGDPLEGVVVVAIWQLELGIMHRTFRGVLWADEALTDAEGDFRIPEWGPIKASSGRMTTTAPALIFFKKGYQLSIKLNPLHSPDYNPKVWESEYDDRVVTLKEFDGDMKGYGKHLSGIEYFLKRTDRLGNVCYWENVPVFTKSVLEMREYFEKRNIYNRLPSENTLRRNGECRNPQDLLESLN